MASMVRLVRACGSKLNSGLVIMQCVGVRLVRACGSKPSVASINFGWWSGQARKSLWIETNVVLKDSTYTLVRLVRACGSKLKLDMSFNVSAYKVRLVRACGSKHENLARATVAN